MSTVSEEIQKAANRWMQAWIRGDAATLEDVLAPDYSLTVSATPNRRLNRADWLATACTRYRASEFNFRDVQVRDLGGGIAVMSSIAEFVAEIDGMPRNGPLFIVDVWRLVGDKWQVSARYSSNPEQSHASAAAVVSLR